MKVSEGRFSLEEQRGGSSAVEQLEQVLEVCSVALLKLQDWMKILSGQCMNELTVTVRAQNWSRVSSPVM